MRLEWTLGTKPSGVCRLPPEKHLPWAGRTHQLAWRHFWREPSNSLKMQFYHDRFRKKHLWKITVITLIIVGSSIDFFPPKGRARMAIIFIVFPLSEGGDVDSPMRNYWKLVLENRFVCTLPLMTVAEYVLNGSCSYICLRDFGPWGLRPETIWSPLPESHGCATWTYSTPPRVLSVFLALQDGGPSSPLLLEKWHIPLFLFSHLPQPLLASLLLLPPHEEWERMFTSFHESSELWLCYQAET